MQDPKAIWRQCSLSSIQIMHKAIMMMYVRFGHIADGLESHQGHEIAEFLMQ